jgi:methyl-accepting chemotaxis protein
MSGLQNAEQKLMDEGNSEATESLESMETRWKYAVFPAMIAFIILAAFGFYLIYGMLQRMEDLSHNVYRMTEVIHTSMPSMQNDMTHMANNIGQINTTIQQNFPSLSNNVSSISNDMKDMSHSTTSMAGTTHNLSQNVWELNNNVSKPLSLMNNMIPWNKTQRVPPPIPMYPQQVIYPQHSTFTAPQNLPQTMPK